MFGHSVSHSMKKTKRRWYPNVQNKRVWSDILDTWVRFKMTTAAMKAIDDIGGIDNYLLSLDNRTVMDSNYVTKIRGIVANLLFHNGSLDEKIIRKLKFDKSPPEKISPEEIDLSHSKKVSRRQHMWRTWSSPFKVLWSWELHNKNLLHFSCSSDRAALLNSNKFFNNLLRIDRVKCMLFSCSSSGVLLLVTYAKI